MTQRTLSIQNVLAQLKAENLLSSENEDQNENQNENQNAGQTDFLQTLLTTTAGEQTPWYIRLFIGRSAWIAAIIFIGFLFTVELGNSKKIMIPKID